MIAAVVPVFPDVPVPVLDAVLSTTGDVPRPDTSQATRPVEPSPEYVLFATVRPTPLAPPATFGIIQIASYTDPLDDARLTSLASADPVTLLPLNVGLLLDRDVLLAVAPVAFRMTELPAVTLLVNVAV